MRNIRILAQGQVCGFFRSSVAYLILGTISVSNQGGSIMKLSNEQINSTVDGFVCSIGGFARHF